MIDLSTVAAVARALGLSWYAVNTIAMDATQAILAALHLKYIARDATVRIHLEPRWRSSIHGALAAGVRHPSATVRPCFSPLIDTRP